MIIPTGFGVVMHSILENLPQENYDIAGLAVNFRGDPHKYPYRIYPASSRGDIYGYNRVQEVCEVEKPELIFLLNDAWILDNYLNEIKQVYEGKTLPKIVTYIPIDAKDHDPDWYKHFDIVDKVVVYTEFGKKVILEAAPQLEDKLSIFPHGTDSSTFYKIDKPKNEIKKALYGNNRPDLYEDSFIVLSCGRNQPRKRLDLLMYGFELFSKGKPENVKIYYHCGVVDMHLNIYKLAKRLNLTDRLVITNRNNGVQTVPAERLNLIYNATDVGVNTSVGEGWCLPTMEHAMTGAPQLIADHSALHELYSDCGLFIPTTYDVTLDHIMTTGRVVRPEDVAEKLETLYCDEGLRYSLSLRAMQKFGREEYSWKSISGLWDKLFTDLV